ncbi:MAG: CDC27 family protein [Cyanobacteria bacterium P01_A01_bin.83]
MSRNTASCLVKLSESSGLDVSAYVVLKQQPSRQEQKIKTLNKYLQKYSSGWKKRLELANLLYETGQWSKAIAQYYRVIQGQPNLIEPRLQLGKILQLINKKEEASLIYGEALKLAKKEATKKHLIGLIESCKNNVKEAIAAFKSATILEPKAIVHWIALGQIQMQSEYLNDALFSFGTILALDATNFMGLIYGYDLSLALGHIKTAEKFLNEAAEIAPQDVQTLKRLIANRYRQKLVLGTEGKQTKKLINLLQKKAPKTPEINHLVAKFYILRGEHTKGINISKQLVTENPDNVYAWYYYSQCLFKLEKYEPAAAAIEKAYKLSLLQNQHCDRSIYRALCEILPLAGKQDLVTKIIDEMLKLFPNSWNLWMTAKKVLVEHFQEEDLERHYSFRNTQLQPQLAKTWLHHRKTLLSAEKYQQAIALRAPRRDRITTSRSETIKCLKF